MPRRERTGDRCATLFTRGDLPRPAARRRTAVVEELASIAADGSLDAFDVVHWAKRVPEADGQTRERTLVEEFREWAERRDLTLAPSFDTRRCYSERTGRRRTELVMPVLCLAVYEDEELVEVAPRGDGDGVVTVGDCIDSLAEESEPPAGEELLATPAD